MMKRLLIFLIAAATAFGEGSETLKLGTSTHNVQSPLTINWTGTTLNFTGATISGLSGGGTPANPTASVGLTVVNGSASTFMRSDAAPPLNQAIFPIWTGLHRFEDGVNIDGTGIANTNFPYLTLANATDATSGVTSQWSPGIEFNGTAWDGAAAIDSVTDLYLETIPGGIVSGIFHLNVNYGDQFKFYENGNLTTTGAITGSNLSGTNTGDQDLSGLVPTSRTLTIAGTALDLTANRSWTLDTITGLSSTGLVKRTAANTLGVITDSSSNWDTAYTDRLKWDGGSTGLTAATGRTSLGATTVGDSLFTLTNPSAISFIRINADNSITARSAANFRSDIGAGTGSGSVTSVDLSTDRNWLTVGGNPITSSGTITLNGTTGLAANQFLGTPDGSTGTVGLRAIVAADVPTLNQNTTGSAAKWTTARNLAGNSVDGSGNVAFANKFIVQGTTDSGLSAAQFLGALGTGIVKNTTTTGVLSIAVAGDFPTLNQNTTGSAASLTTGRTISITGDVTYTSGSFDGTGNVTGTGTLANIPDATTAAGSVLFTDIAAPASPAAAHLKIFGDSTDLRFHDKNAAGTIGTTVVSDTGSSNNFLTAVSAAGVISKAQPAIANVSDATTVGQNIVKLTNPGAITFLKMNADNTVTARSAANFKTDLSLTIGTDVEAWDTQLDSLAGLSYTGNSLKVVRVNSGETGFELATAGSGTVTNTGGNLTSNAVVLGAGTVDTKVSTGIITDGASKLTLGLNTSTLGQVKLFGNTSGDATIQPAAVAGTATTVTLPNASSTLPIFGQQITFSGPTAARTITLPDAAFTVARTDAANTFTGASTTTSWAENTPVITGGLTASGSGSNNFSSSTGAFQTSSGANTFNGTVTITPPVRTSGTASYFTLNIPADTAQTAATESIGYQHATATRQWATTGTVALQRENFFAGPTYSSASASQTFTDAFTLYATPPVAGTNAIFTRDHTLGIVDSTSAASSITGGLVVATTLGTSATSVGVGGGNVNAGGNGTFGGTLSVTGHDTLEGVTSTGATGTGKHVYDTSPTLSNPVVGTQSTGDNSTKAASTAYVDGTSNRGGWTTLWVSGSDFTTTNLTATTITGLTTATLSNSTVYEVELNFYMASSSAAGDKLAISCGGSGTAGIVVLTGTQIAASSTASASGLSGPDALGNAVVASAADGAVFVKGFVKTRGSGTATIIAQLAKVTSGTATVYQGSVMRYRQAGQ